MVLCRVTLILSNANLKKEYKNRMLLIMIKKFEFICYSFFLLYQKLQSIVDKLAVKSEESEGWLI